ncbi:MAG: NapC/NirT family cytochrome c [Rhodospirillales bacterium]
MIRPRRHRAIPGERFAGSWRDRGQYARPQRAKRPRAMKQGKTCIDCHKGIAHMLPDDYGKGD